MLGFARPIDRLSGPVCLPRGAPSATRISSADGGRVRVPKRLPWASTNSTIPSVFSSCRTNSSDATICTIEGSPFSLPFIVVSRLLSVQSLLRGVLYKAYSVPTQKAGNHAMNRRSPWRGFKWTTHWAIPVMATDYEVLGLTSGDWPLSGRVSYIGRSFISLRCVLGRRWTLSVSLTIDSRAGSVLHDYSRCRRLGKFCRSCLTASSYHSLQDCDRLDQVLLDGRTFQ